MKTNMLLLLFTFVQFSLPAQSGYPKVHIADDLELIKLSDDNQIATNNFEGTKSALPLKTLVTHAGLGWIGKNNLLVNKDYGCSQVWGGILTNAPVNTIVHDIPAVQCGVCRECLDVCQPKALKGRTWQAGIQRDEIVDVDICTICLKCMVHCPWTQK
jgi:epoxyqueuosine reductase QueG